MSNEIIQSVAYDILTSYFHKISFHYFEDCLRTKLTLK